MSRLSGTKTFESLKAFKSCVSPSTLIHTLFEFDLIMWIRNDCRGEAKVSEKKIVPLRAETSVLPVAHIWRCHQSTQTPLHILRFPLWSKYIQKTKEKSFFCEPYEPCR